MHSNFRHRLKLTAIRLFVLRCYTLVGNHACESTLIGKIMKSPAWLSPALYGAVAGALAVAIVGFTWGGWVTGSTAMKMSTEAVDIAVVSSLTPYCLAQSKVDPNASVILADLQAAKSYNRRDIIEKAGWATPLGEEKPNRDLAVACVNALTDS
jgi:hypothetical protein